MAAACDGRNCTAVWGMHSPDFAAPDAVLAHLARLLVLLLLSLVPSGGVGPPRVVGLCGYKRAVQEVQAGTISVGYTTAGR